MPEEAGVKPPAASTVHEDRLPDRNVAGGGPALRKASEGDLQKEKPSYSLLEHGSRGRC